MTTAPYRLVRVGILFVYFVLVYFGFQKISELALAPFYTILANAALVIVAVPIWFGMERIARANGEKEAVVEAAFAGGDPLAALDAPEASKAESGAEREVPPSSQAGGQAAQLSAPEVPRSEPPAPERMVRVKWTRTQELEGYVPIEGIKVTKQDDSSVELVKEKPET
jgi:hypothetical protein